MNDFRLKTLVLGWQRTNCYIISDGESKEAIIIDPGDEAEKIEQYLKENDLVCQGILLTHGHFDHILAVEKVASVTNATIYAHEQEAQLLKDPELNCSVDILRNCSLEAGIWLKDQQKIVLAGFEIKVIHTPGHTSGGICYYFKDHGVLFSGDTLFRETIGRYDFPTGDGNTLVASILNKLMVFPDEIKVFPGHGAPTTIGYERNNNIYLTNDSFLNEI